MARPRFSPFYRLFPFPFSHFESKFPRFFEGTSLFSAPNFNFSLLRPVLPHTSDTSSRDLTLYYRHTSLFAQREGFFISSFTFSPIFPTFIFPTTVFPPHNHPTLFASSPTLFLFPPHFSISLPNKHTNARTLAHYVRTRTSAQTLAPQEVFVYCLHRFTHPSQSTGHQCVRGEEKREKAFTKHSTTSQSIY